MVKPTTLSPWVTVDSMVSSSRSLAPQKEHLFHAPAIPWAHNHIQLYPATRQQCGCPSLPASTQIPSAHLCFPSKLIGLGHLMVRTGNARTHTLTHEGQARAEQLTVIMELRRGSGVGLQDVHYNPHLEVWDNCQEAHSGSHCQ